MKYLLCFLLVGCAGVKIPETVLVPVHTPCIVDYPLKPDIATKEQLQAMSNSDYVIQITIDYLKLLDYSDKLRASTIGCK